MENHQDGHDLAVRHAARAVTVPRAGGGSNVCLLNSGSKYLQNSSRMQKISIKSVDVIGSEFYLYYFDFQL